eukprot:3817177-Prymnesium_polylepis.1
MIESDQTRRPGDGRAALGVLGTPAACRRGCVAAAAGRLWVGWRSRRGGEPAHARPSGWAGG